MDKEQTISVKLPDYLHKDLIERAEQNERTLSQEVRLALKLYVARADGKKS